MSILQNSELVFHVSTNFPANYFLCLMFLNLGCILNLMACYNQVNTITLMTKNIIHRCVPGGSMCTCHAAGPGLIPGQDKFPG